MDNLKKVLPIRNYQLKHPLFVAFNIHLTHYNAYGVSHYQRLFDALTHSSGAKLAKKSVYLLPNITNLDTSIEIRGKSLAKAIDTQLKMIGAEKCHLVAHSFTGIDSRSAISMFGADKQVQSLTTVSTPHQGMKLIDITNDKAWRGNLLNLERVFEVLGITGKSVQEFTSHNIGCFNEVCEDAEGVDYFSIGAKKGGKIMSTILADS